MSTFLIVLLALVVLYVFVVRPILLRRTELGLMFSESEHWREYLADLLKGLKTRLVARVVILAPTLLAIHDFLLPLLPMIDVTPISSHVPPAVWLALTTGVGSLFNWLRNVTPSTNDAIGGP